jgi:zinc transporter 5/7
VVLLFLTLGLHVGYNTASKKLCVDVGGAKRLHALSSLIQAAILGPWAAFIYFTREVRTILAKCKTSVVGFLISVTS